MSENESLATLLPVTDERILDAHYYPGQRGYLIPSAGGGWVAVNHAGLKIALKKRGMSNVAVGGQLLTDIELFTDELHTQYAVDYAGPLAGYRYGLYQENGYNVLVTDELKLPEAVQGECPVIEALFGRWFGDEQLPYVLGWLKHAYLNLLPDNKAFQPAQLLAVCGLPGAGKNLFQDIVTAVLGGRVAKPYRYLSSGTEFNADLTGAEHLQISDEVANQDYKTRRKFGSALKDICVNSVQSIHSKGKNAINLPVRWRMTASLNDRDEDLHILPTYEPQLWEKIILIKIGHGRDLLPDSAGREAFWTQIKGELPALCHHLITHQVPEAIRHPRYGVRHFHNKDLLTALDQLSPEVQLHDLIYEHVLDGGSISEWKGSASELMNILFNDHQTEYQAKRVCKSIRQTGIYLNRLEEKKGSNYILVDVTNKRNTHRRWYEIKPKAQP